MKKVKCNVVKNFKNNSKKNYKEKQNIRFYVSKLCSSNIIYLQIKRDYLIHIIYFYIIYMRILYGYFISEIYFFQELYFREI